MDKTPGITALEAMAKAYWNATTDKYNKWDTLDETEIMLQVRAMRAVLLALAATELPECALNAACSENDSIVGRDFSAICYALAAE